MDGAAKYMTMPPTDIIPTDSSMLSATALTARRVWPAPDLAHHRRQGRTYTHGRHENHGVDVVADAEGGDGVLAKAEDKGVHNHKAETSDGLPEAGRHAHLDYLQEDFGGKPQITDAQAQAAVGKNKMYRPAKVLKALAATVAQAAPATPCQR